MRWRRALAVSGCVACAGTPNTTFELDVPAAIAGKAAWYEIGVFAGGCPSPSLLLDGIPPEGTIGRVAFAATSSTPPALGLLPTQSDGIAAVARAADCSVIATGCSAISVGGSGALAVALSAVQGAAGGACASGASCSLASCVPGGDAAIVSGSCSLQLVGQGPLADPLDPGSTLLSAPAISATAGGFLVAYREFDPSGTGSARLTTLAIDQNGAAAPPVQTSLPGACSGNPQTDATALLFAGAKGTIALSHPACSGVDGGASAGGVDVLAIDANGAIQQSSFSGQVGLDVTLGPAHALANTPLGTVLVYTNPSTQTSFAAMVNGVALASAPAPLPFSTFSNLAETSAYVVGTSYGSAFVSLGPFSADAGSSDAGSGSQASVATLAAVDGGVDAGPLSSAYFAATWASASAVGSRVLVASNGPSSDASIVWSAFDIGSSTAGPTGSFAPMSAGSVSFVDVAVHQDHAFFAAEVDQSLSLFAFDKAAEIPVFLLEVPFSSLPVLPVGALRDGLVAVAASDTQVAVVWGTGKSLGADDDVGGYAVFACTTP